jgi:signal peptidase I
MPMRFYDVYEHPTKGRKAVKDGFSWPAFFFFPLWPFLKGLWLLGAVCLIPSAFAIILEELHLVPLVLWWAILSTAIPLLVGIAVGVLGNAWVCKSLVRRGFLHVAKVAAQSHHTALGKAMESEIRIDADVTTSGGILSPALACLFAFFILISSVTLTSYYIPSEGMLNTLRFNDRVLVNILTYIFSEPKVGDIVVFWAPEEIPHYDPEKPIWLQRIVGVGGDSVSIEENRLVVNGSKVRKPPFLRENSYFPRSLEGAVFEDVVVPDDHVMVFGDNSADSYDSRFWGPVHVDRIVGKVLVRFWPPSRIGPVRGESARPLAEN